MDFPHRLKREEGLELVKAIKKAGFLVEVRPRTEAKAPPATIWIWENIEPKRYLGALRWIAKVGWRMELTLPVIHTDQDFEFALRQLISTPRMQQQTTDAWETYQKHKSQKNLGEYLGLLAAYYTGASNQ